MRIATISKCLWSIWAESYKKLHKAGSCHVADASVLRRRRRWSCLLELGSKMRRVLFQPPTLTPPLPEFRLPMILHAP
jgi:hypothetical protein